MKHFILLLTLTLLLILNISKAQDSLNVSISKFKFNTGDTIVLDYDYKFDNKLSATSTMHLWIENINTHSIWKYRYPLVNGSLSNSIIVGKDIPQGKYAFNFMVQKQFFAFYGHIKNYNKKSKGLNFVMLGKQKGAYFDKITPDEDGNFKTPRFMFEDTSRFIFSTIGEQNNRLFIEALTPLDSTFKTSVTQTILLNIGDSVSEEKPYTFNQSIFDGNYTLKQVVVTSIKKKKIEKFDEEYSSGLFKGGLAKVFDGIESNEIANSFDILLFLQSRIAGLRIQRNNNFSVSDSYNITWRNRPVDIFIDEFKIESSGQLYINPSDVAMIKVFGPLEGGPTLNGCIAIYTKRGEYEDSDRKYNFLVKGYTPSIIEWNK